MNKETLEKLWKSYLDVYADIPADERERLLRQSVTDDVVSTNPDGEIQGIGNLAEHIEQFQKKSPGAYLKSNKVLTNHNQLLSEWTICGKDGSEIATGHAYARFNGQGRLTHLTGFWDV
jgi:hypothetical protein